MSALLVPDVVIDNLVGAGGVLVGLCGVNRLAVLCLVIAFVIFAWSLARWTGGLNRWSILILGGVLAVGFQRVVDQAAVPTVSLDHYGVHDSAPPFVELRAGHNESWGTISTRNDGWFEDEHGRVLLLRGVNLAGSSKVPVSPDGATHVGIGNLDWLRSHRNVSFVGRPFPLEEADEHLARLRSWGLTFVRFLVTWEAIEHAGPGVYDYVRLHVLGLRLVVRL